MMGLYQSLVVAIVTMVMRMDFANGCSCLQAHPQTHFCEADFVMLTRVRSEGEMFYQKVRSEVSETGTIPPVVERFPVEVKYSVRVKKLFKVKENNVGLSKNTTVTDIYTAPDGGLCGIELNPRAKVLLSGRFDSKGRLSVHLCDWVTPWPWVSKVQKKGLRYLYEENCGCQVVNSILGSMQDPFNLPVNNNTVCVWEPNRQDSDCFLRHSACVLDKNSSTGGCKWHRNNHMKECREDVKSPRREP